MSALLLQIRPHRGDLSEGAACKHSTRAPGDRQRSPPHHRTTDGTEHGSPALAVYYDTQIETNPNHLPRNPKMKVEVVCLKNRAGSGRAFIHASRFEALNSRQISDMLKIICINSSLKRLPHSLLQQEAIKHLEMKARRNLIFTPHALPT